MLTVRHSYNVSFLLMLLLFIVVDLKELLLNWSHLPKPLWKKSLAFSKLAAKMGLSSEFVSQCIFDIVEESSTGTICRLSSSAAAFLLLYS